MENASKALLIAGAVLIVILLIGIGMLIYSRSTGVVNTASNSMNAQEIQAFNGQFTPYQDSQPGSSVRALINTVIANNNSSSNVVTINNVGKKSDETSDNTALTTKSQAVDTTATYLITFTFSFILELLRLLIYLSLLSLSLLLIKKNNFVL